MWAAFTTKVAVWWKLVVGVVVAAIPVIAYMFGRKDGKSIEQTNNMKEAVRAEKTRADFYYEMEKAANEAHAKRPVTRDGVVERLRKHGL